MYGATKRRLRNPAFVKLLETGSGPCERRIFGRTGKANAAADSTINDGLGRRARACCDALVASCGRRPKFRRRHFEFFGQYLLRTKIDPGAAAGDPPAR